MNGLKAKPIVMATATLLLSLFLLSFCCSRARPAGHPALSGAGNLKNATALAISFLRDYENKASEIMTGATEASWTYETDLSEMNGKLMVEKLTLAQEFDLESSTKASGIPYVDLSHDASRQIMLIRRNAMPKSPKKMKELNKLQANMTSLYSEGKVCKKNSVSKKPRCFSLDDLYGIMAKSRDHDELLWAWKGWRDSVGPPIRPLFEKFVGLLNTGANDHNWGDYGNFQRREYEMGNDFQPMLRKLWVDVRPLYYELHAYTRFKLRQKYPQVPEKGPLPAHLMGNMWAQDWSEIYDLLRPFPKLPSLDITPNLIKQKYSVERLFKLAQSFFVSLGLDPMPASFWRKSLMTKPSNASVVCHASAWDFSNGDVR